MEWSNWIPAISSSTVLLGVAYLARDLVKASIEKGVQHKFDEKIENLRTNLRNSEETFKRDLRAKEIEIAALRDGALSGMASRQALLDKRRLEAVERTWSAVVDLAPAKAIAMTMSIVKFEASAKVAARNPDFRKVFEIFGKTFDLTNAPKNVARYEQPFVSPMAWAFFSAFQAVVMHAVVQMKMLELGVEDAQKIIEDKNAKKLLKAALPHQSNYIDQYGRAGFYNLLDEIERNLISELWKMLEGTDIDEASVEQSAKIMKLADKVSAENFASGGDLGSAKSV